MELTKYWSTTEKSRQNYNMLDIITASDRKIRLLGYNVDFVGNFS